MPRFGEFGPDESEAAFTPGIVLGVVGAQSAVAVPVDVAETAGGDLSGSSVRCVVGFGGAQLTLQPGSFAVPGDGALAGVAAGPTVRGRSVGMVGAGFGGPLRGLVLGECRFRFVRAPPPNVTICSRWVSNLNLNHNRGSARPSV